MRLSSRRAPAERPLKPPPPDVPVRLCTNGTALMQWCQLVAAYLGLCGQVSKPATVLVLIRCGDTNRRLQVCRGPNLRLGAGAELRAAEHARRTTGPGGAQPRQDVRHAAGRLQNGNASCETRTVSNSFISHDDIHRQNGQGVRYAAARLQNGGQAAHSG